jgi:hypothetical protein
MYPRLCASACSQASYSKLDLSRSEIVGPALLLGPCCSIVASGVGLELRLVGVDNLAAAVLALYRVGRSAMRNDAVQCKSISWEARECLRWTSASVP